jgi:hypothetical protein
MKQFFARNIDSRGRIARAVFGVLLIVVAAACSSCPDWMRVALAVFGAFALFEAFRGWCLMRACGVKTRM